MKRISKKRLKKLIDYCYEPLIVVKDRKTALQLCSIIMSLASEGYTISLILKHLNLNEQIFKKYRKKYKEIKAIIPEAQFQFQQYGLQILREAALSGKKFNQQIFMLFIKEFWDISDKPKELEKSNNIRKKYIVKTTTTEEKINYEEAIKKEMEEYEKQGIDQ